jgi:hypothetical protein
MSFEDDHDSNRSLDIPDNVEVSGDGVDGSVSVATATSVSATVLDDGGKAVPCTAKCRFDRVWNVYFECFIGKELLHNRFHSLEVKKFADQKTC